MIKKSTNQPYGGFILTFEPARCERIAVALLYGKKEATETFSAVDWTFFLQELVFLSLDSEEEGIHGAALMENMKVNGATGKYKMRLHSPAVFESPLLFSELPRAYRTRRLRSTSIDLRRMDAAKWKALIDQVKRLRPSEVEKISALEAERTEERRIFPTGERAERLMEQRDAVGLAVEIAGLDRQSILKSLRPTRSEHADSVLDLLDSEPLQEQDAIRKDEIAFGSLLLSGMRHARFSDRSGAEVRIHIYDKKPLETAIGIDLLIYQSAYKSYILIQYKMMSLSGRRRDKWSYTADDQLHKQLEAMDRVSALVPDAVSMPEPLEDWRLSREVFFWKFCEPTRQSDSAGALTHGITLTRSHLGSFLALPQSAGTRTSRRIGYGNCDRYITNSQFVDLASNGWIGGGSNARALIENLLAANQQGGRQTILAAIKHAEREGKRVRGWKR